MYIRTCFAGIAIAIGLPTIADAQFLGKSATKWLAELKGPDAAARRSAAFSLGKLGQASPEVVDALRQALEGNDAKLQDAAAFALGELAGEDADSVWNAAGKTLRDKLGAGEPAVRRSAAFALGCCGANARDAEGDLVKALQSEGPELAGVRQNAAWALGQVQRKAKSGQGGDAVKALSSALGRPDEDILVMRDVAAALGQISRPAAEPAAPDLARLAGTSTDPAVRRMALNTLVNVVGPSIAKETQQRRDLVLRELQKSLRTGDPEFKGLAAAALGNLGEHAAPAIGDLARLVEDSKNVPSARRNGAIALSKMPRQIFDLPDEERRDTIRRVGRAIDLSAPADVRQHALEAIYHFPLPLLEEVVPNLVKIIQNDTEARVRQNAVFAFLYKDGSREVRGLQEALGGALKDTSKSLRYTAARQLSYMQRQETGDAVIAVLEEMLHDELLRIYRGTDTTVRAGGEGNTGGTTAEVQLLGDGRYLAAEALAFIGPKVKKNERIVKTLRGMTESKDNLTSKHAREALAAMGL